jgi:hypothetical protein
MRPGSFLAFVLLLGAWPLAIADSTDKKPQEKPPPKQADGPLPIDQLLARNKELVPVLLDGLKDPDPQVRQMAAHTLVTIGKDAIPELVAALASKDADLRANAAYILGQFGATAQAALPALVRASKDADSEVRQRMIYAISRIIGETPPLPRPLPPMPPAKPDEPDKMKEPEKKEPEARGPRPGDVILTGYALPRVWYEPGLRMPNHPIFPVLPRPLDRPPGLKGPPSKSPSKSF